MNGFVLTTPKGYIVPETFRPTSEAVKGWLALIKMSDGRYHDWKHYRREGWRCKAATLQLKELK